MHVPAKTIFSPPPLNFADENVMGRELSYDFSGGHHKASPTDIEFLQKIANENGIGKCFSHEEAKAWYNAARKAVEWQNSICRVSKKVLPTGKVCYLGDCEKCFKHIQCPACVRVMFLEGKCDLLEKCKEVYGTRLKEDYAGKEGGGGGDR